MFLRCFNCRCYLATFYFKRKMLSQFETCNSQDSLAMADTETNVIEFVEKFGSYLNLYEALIAASDCFSINVIQKLINLASYDPTHNEYVKLFSKDGILVPYDTKLFSCLLACLSLFEREGKGRGNILEMIVAAYPDLKPWQVRSMMLDLVSKDNETLTTKVVRNATQDDVVFYYEYLSLLMESSQMARFDSTLVKEWCFLSTSEDFTWEKEKRKQNFINMAEKSNTEDGLIYIRDLPFLIETSQMINEHSLTLKLASEIFTSTESSFVDEVGERVLSILHVVSNDCIDVNTGDNNTVFDTVLMRQILLLLKHISTSSVGGLNGIVNICTELGILLDQCKQSENALAKEESLITLIAETIPTTDMLATLSNRSLDHISSGIVVSALRTSFENAVITDTGDEITTALFRLQQIRPTVESPREKCHAPFIWHNLLHD